MKPKWWPVLVTCPTCNESVPIDSAQFSADGELLFVFRCDKCEAMVHFKAFASKLAHMALLNDIHAATKTIERGPITPPLAIAPPAFTEQDLKDLHALHILDDTEEAA